MNNSTLVMVAALAAIAMMAAVVVVLLIHKQVHKIRTSLSNKDKRTHAVALHSVATQVQ